MKIVDDFMRQGYREGVTFRDMWEGYMLYGEDPFIESDDPNCKFSAWTSPRIAVGSSPSPKYD
jgi:hypothetical protein